MTQPIDATQIDAEYEEWLQGHPLRELMAKDKPLLAYMAGHDAARSASAQEIARLTEELNEAQYWRERHSKDNEALGQRNHEQWLELRALRGRQPL